MKNSGEEELSHKWKGTPLGNCPPNSFLTPDSLQVFPWKSSDHQQISRSYLMEPVASRDPNTGAMNFLLHRDIFVA